MNTQFVVWDISTLVCALFLPITLKTFLNGESLSADMRLFCAFLSIIPVLNTFIACIATVFCAGMMVDTFIERLFKWF